MLFLIFVLQQSWVQNTIHHEFWRCHIASQTWQQTLAFADAGEQLHSISYVGCLSNFDVHHGTARHELVCLSMEPFGRVACNCSLVAWTLALDLDAFCWKLEFSRLNFEVMAWRVLIWSAPCGRQFLDILLHMTALAMSGSPWSRLSGASSSEGVIAQCLQACSAVLQ